MTGIRWLWFALRILLANMLHIATFAFFTFLHKLKGIIFVIGGIGSIAMYYYLNKRFTAPDNYTIPFFVWLWVMACAGTQCFTQRCLFIDSLRVLGSEEENSDCHYQGADNDK